MNKRQKFYFLLSISVLALALLGGSAWVNAAHLPAAGGPPSQLEAQIVALQADLVEIELPEARQALQEKLAIQQSALDLRREAQSQSAPTLSEICASRIEMPDPKTTLEMGILDVRPDFMAQAGFQITTMARDLWQNHLVEVYAGSRLDDLSHGILIISIEELGVREIITTPQPAGAFTIIAIKDQRLTLQTSDGTMHYFDIPAMQFAASLTDELPLAEFPTAPIPPADPCSKP